jgi:hypothetical protein
MNNGKSQNGTSFLLGNEAIARSESGGIKQRISDCAAHRHGLTAVIKNHSVTNNTRKKANL